MRNLLLAAFLLMRAYSFSQDQCAFHSRVQLVPSGARPMIHVGGFLFSTAEVSSTNSRWQASRLEYNMSEGTNTKHESKAEEC